MSFIKNLKIYLKIFKGCLQNRAISDKYRNFRKKVYILNKQVGIFILLHHLVRAFLNVLQS